MNSTCVRRYWEPASNYLFIYYIAFENQIRTALDFMQKVKRKQHVETYLEEIGTLMRNDEIQSSSDE